MQRRAGISDGEARGRTLGAVIKEKDEELALFLEMRRREKERGAAADQLLLSGGAAAGDGVLQLDALPPAGESYISALFVGPPAAVPFAFCSCFDGNPSLL